MGNDTLTTLVLSLIAAAFLPYIAKIPLAVAMHKAGGYDTSHPREQQAQLKGFGARALAAHQNAFESLIVFAAAILLAITTDTTNETVLLLAILHICFRLAYHVFYLLDKGVLRSLSWAIAMVCSFTIMWLCIPG